MNLTRPRIGFIIVGVIAVLLAAGILYINYFGTPKYLVEKRILTRSPYEAEARKIFAAIADLKSFQLAGEIKGEGFSFISTSTADLINDKILKIDLSSHLNFPTVHKNYSALVELRRLQLENFYFKISQSVLPPEVKSLLQDLLNIWIVADANLIQQAAPEENYDLGFDEKLFLENLRQTLRTTPPIILTRKLGDGHYEYVATAQSLAKFLGQLIGNLSGQSFPEEEVSYLADSLYGYDFNGEIVIDTVSNLPKEIIFNWQDLLLGDLLVSNIDQPVEISKPEKAVDLEKLLK